MESESLDPDLVNIIEKHGYKVDGIVGKGGFAIILKVFSLKYQNYFAAKCFDIGNGFNSHSISSYSAEINSLRELCHPHIISIYDHFSHGKYLCIILEYCPYGTLSRIIPKNSPMPSPILFYVASSLISALSLCHQHNISHKDIKPSNILIDSYQRVKVADFGLSQKTLSNSVFRFGGSLSFLSPEILQRKSHDPFASDVWSLGVLFYLCSFGRLPFIGQTEDAILKSICTNLNKPYFPHSNVSHSSGFLHLEQNIPPKEKGILPHALTETDEIFQTIPDNLNQNPIYTQPDEKLQPDSFLDKPFPLRVFFKTKNVIKNSSSNTKIDTNLFFKPEYITGDSDEVKFRQIIFKMLDFDPKQRPTLSELKANPLFNQERSKPDLSSYLGSQKSNTSGDSSSRSDSEHSFRSMTPQMRTGHTGRNNKSHRSLPPCYEVFPTFL